MRDLRPALPLWLLAMMLAVSTTPLMAAECPVSGSGYASPYNSPIGLPRCAGTIGKWTTCEVCLTSTGTYTEQGAYTCSYTPPGTTCAYSSSPGAGLQPRAVFSQGATSLTVDGFFDGLVSGHAVFRVRFAPTTSSGTWNYSATSFDAGLNLSGSFAAGTSSSKGFLRRDPSYPQDFVWDDGTHPFLWGQTYYQIVNEARAGSASLWQPAVTNSAAYGMNKIRLLVSPWSGDNRSSVNVESKAFQKTGVNLNRDLLDVDHWKALDQVESFLQGQGIVTDLILFHDGDATSTPFGTTLQNQRYTRYTTARYGAFPNVIWTLANEYQLVTGGTSPANNGPWNDLGCLIRGGCGGYGTGADPWIVSGSSWRPLSNHNNVNTSQNLSYPCFEFFTAGWPGHIALQTKKGGSTPDVEAFGAVSRNRNLAAPSVCSGLSSSTRLPVIDDEYGYVGNFSSNTTTDRTLHRQAVWAIAAGGGFGSTGSILGPSDPACGTPPLHICDPTLYTTWQDQPGHYGDIHAVMTFFNSLTSWWRMSGDLSIPAQSRVYALSEPNVHFMIYSALGSTVALNVPAPPASHQWSYCFVSPQSGVCTDKVLRLTGGGTQTFTMPDSNDWAMRFDVF